MTQSGGKKSKIDIYDQEGIILERNFPAILGLSLILHVVVFAIFMVIDPVVPKATLKTMSVPVGVKYVVPLAEPGKGGSSSSKSIPLDNPAEPAKSETVPLPIPKPEVPLPTPPTPPLIKPKEEPITPKPPVALPTPLPKPIPQVAPPGTIPIRHIENTPNPSSNLPPPPPKELTVPTITNSLPDVAPKLPEPTPEGIKPLPRTVTVPTKDPKNKADELPAPPPRAYEAPEQKKQVGSPVANELANKKEKSSGAPPSPLPPLPSPPANSPVAGNTEESGNTDGPPGKAVAGLKGLQDLQKGFIERQYHQRLQIAIKQNLLAPQLFDKTLETLIELTINPQGRLLRSPRMIKSSGNESFDIAALNSVKNAEIPPLPEELAKNPPYLVTISISP